MGRRSLHLELGDIANPESHAVQSQHDAEKLLLAAGFALLRSKESHRVYYKDRTRVVVPFHAGKILHPKIVRQVMDAIDSDKLLMSRPSTHIFIPTISRYDF
jgi:predicted RNA binding protein YcfA (HicA-like mRNA interferase family)